VPTADEVAALMVGDGSEAVDRRDIVLAQQAGPFQRISELHVGYMALHYPLLFPYGEDGWHPNIQLNGVVADVDLGEDQARESELQRKHCNVTMVEFYGYRLQHPTLMASRCFGVADCGNNTLWMLMRLLNKIA
jgi:hypothetical protein